MEGTQDMGIATVETVGLSPAPALSAEEKQVRHDALRAEVLRVKELRACPMTDIAKEVGVPYGTFSQWVGGSYNGRVDRIDETVSRWLRGLDGAKRAAAALREAPGFVPTPASERFIAAFEHAQYAPDLAVVSGAAGVGKTTAIGAYRAQVANVWVVTGEPCITTPRMILDEIAELLGLSEGRSTHRISRGIVERVRGTCGLLVVDEAQHLNTATLDQLRTLHDLAGIGVVFCGNESVHLRFSLDVAQGQILAASNIAITVNPFTNYSYRAEYSQRPVGTPTVSGFPDPSKVTWSIPAMERFNWMMDHPKSALLAEDDDARGGIGRPRFACDPNTGAVVVQAPLSDTTGTPGEWFDLSATDGVRVCTRRVYVPVTPVVGPKFYVGPNATPAGMTAKSSLATALSVILGWPPETDVTSVAGLEIHIEYDPANPNRYVQDWEQNYNLVRRGYNGPFAVIGIPGPNGQLPFVGGARGSSNVGIGDQGLFYCNQGDVRFENLELGFIHMAVFGGDYAPASNRTMSLIRRMGGASGDVTIRNCDLHDADVPIEAGNSDGHWTLDHIRLTNGSGCTSGGGANQHNAYLGMIWKITATNLLSYGCADGHIFKTRAAYGVWTDCRFYDGERGSGFNAVDLCCGGSHTFLRCHFEKGPAAQNPYMIQFGEELPGALPWSIPAQDYVHALAFDQCIFTNHATRPVWATGEHGAAAVNFVGRISPNTGVPATLSITNTVFEGYTSAEVAVFSSNLDGGHDFTKNFTQSGNTFPATFTPLNFASPVSYDLGRPGWHDSVADLNHKGNFPYFGARQFDPGTDEIRIPANAAPGTLVCHIKAYGAPNWSLSGNLQPDPRINPFIAGTRWGPGQTLVDYTGTSFGYAQDHYAYKIYDNGEADILVGANGLGRPGLDVFLARATSPSSTGSVIAEIPLFVVKT